MKKILIISDEYPPFLGGIARYAGEVATGLARREYEVHVLCNQRNTSQMTEENRDVCVHFYDRPTTGLRGKVFLFLELPRILRQLMLRVGATNLLVVDPVNALSLPLTRRGVNVKHSVVLHGSEIRRYAERWLTRRLLGAALRSAQQVFTTTSFVDDELHQHFRMRGSKTSCGVGHEFLNQPRDESLIATIRQRYDIPSDAFVLGTICRLDYRKGHDLVLQALAGIRSQQMNRQNTTAGLRELRYVIGGTGDERARLEALVDELNLTDQVIFAGRVAEEELVSHYDLLDLFVMPNRLTTGTVEGFGISFVEAAARGVPSIGVDNGGVREAIANEVSGILLPAANKEHVQSAINSVLTDEIQCDPSEVRDHALAFSWDNVVDNIAHAL